MADEPKPQYVKLAAAPLPGHVEGGIIHLKKGGTIPDYDGSKAGYYVPGNFDRTRPFVAVIYHHGFALDGDPYRRKDLDSVADAFERQQVGKQIEASGINAIVIVPQGMRGPRTIDSIDARKNPVYSDKDTSAFKQKGSYDRFIKEMASHIAPGDAELADRITKAPLLSVSYSGGYVPQADLLKDAKRNHKIAGVIGIDSLYDPAIKDALEPLVKKPAAGETAPRIILIHNSNGNYGLVADKILRNAAGEKQLASAGAPLSDARPVAIEKEPINAKRHCGYVENHFGQLLVRTGVAALYPAGDPLVAQKPDNKPVAVATLSTNRDALNADLPAAATPPSDDGANDLVGYQQRPSTGAKLAVKSTEISDLAGKGDSQPATPQKQVASNETLTHRFFQAIGLAR